MNRDAIERVAMDWAGGELSPDIEQLLQAYLDHVPEHQAVVQEIVQRYDAVKRAFARTPRLVTSSCHVKSPSRIRAWGPYYARVAAVLVAVGMGMCIGGYLLPHGTVAVPARVGERPVSHAEQFPSILPDSQDMWGRYVTAIRDGRDRTASVEARAHEVKLFFNGR